VTQISIRAMDKVSLTAISNEMKKLYPGVPMDESLYKEDPKGDGWHLVATRTPTPKVKMVPASEVYKKNTDRKLGKGLGLGGLLFWL